LMSSAVTLRGSRVLSSMAFAPWAFGLLVGRLYSWRHGRIIEPPGRFGNSVGRRRVGH
jgi:hypothetical protein